MIIWLTGIPGSGKTTIAEKLAPLLNGHMLDADVLRQGLCAGLGHSREGKFENLKRIAVVAYAYSHYCVPVVAAVTPFNDARAMIEEICGKVFWVHCDCPVDIAASRKVDLYNKFTHKELAGNYEKPKRALRLDTGSMYEDECVKEIIQNMGKVL